MSQWKSIRQDVKDSPDNSSTANLVASATFTGTGVSTLGVNAIQVSLKADQNCVVYVDQSPDNSNWDLVDSYNYYLGLPEGFGITVQVINSYVRVRVTNIGTVTTTFFRLQTVLCPIVEALPRSLDEDGNLKIGLKSIQDQYGFDVESSPQGALKTVDVVRLAGAAFAGTTPDTNFWTPTIANGGTVSYLGAEAQIRTGATLNGSAILNSVRVARYVGGQSNQFRAQIVCDVGVTGNVRRWGLFDASNGAFFELNGAAPGGQRVVTRKSGVDTVVSNGSFNGIYGTTVGSIGTTIHTYEIYVNNRNVHFVWDDKLVHTVEASSTAWTASMSLPVRIENVNTAISNDISLYVRSAMINRLGQASTRPKWYYIHGALGATVLKYGPGSLHKVVVNIGAGTSITLYDAITTTNPICIIDPGNVRGSINYDLDFYTGLTVVTVGAGTDVTIVYE